MEKKEILEQFKAINGETLLINLPDGKSWVEIREQNGADDDLLSNRRRADSLMNFCDFISSITLRTNYTENGKLTPEDVASMPALMKYVILVNSRMHSLGKTIGFQYKWPEEVGGYIENYEEDLSQLVFNDYHNITDEEIIEKPLAIPFYDNLPTDGYYYITTSKGKELRYRPMDTKGEKYLIDNMVEGKKNDAIIARGLEFQDKGQWHKVATFASFSPKEMNEIRKDIQINDPEFTGNILIESSKGHQTYYNVMGSPSFFYPGEI